MYKFRMNFRPFPDEHDSESLFLVKSDNRNRNKKNDERNDEKKSIKITCIKKLVEFVPEQNIFTSRQR